MRSPASSLLIACSLSEGSGHLLNSRILSNRANSKVFFDRVGFPPDLADHETFDQASPKGKEKGARPSLIVSMARRTRGE